MADPRTLSISDKVAILALITTVAVQAIPLNATTRSLFLLVALGAAAYLCWHALWARWKKWTAVAIFVVGYVTVTLLLFEQEARATRSVAPTTILVQWSFNAFLQIPWRWVLPSIVGTAFVATVAFLITLRRKRQSVSTPCPHEWAHEIVPYEIERIRKFVLVETCAINASHLAKGELYVDFTFSILNLSIFVVSISTVEGAVLENPIFFKGQMLSREAKLTEKQVTYVNPTDRGNFTIRQWVNSDEAKDITQTLEKCGNLFDFSRAVVSISIHEFPDAEAAKLDLTRGMQNAALENKLVELGNDNTWLRRGLTLWQERAGKIEELTRTLGMFYRAYNQLEQGEILSQETANSLKGRFAQALHYCFHDNRVYDEYYDNLPPLPDSIPEQKTWIDDQCSKLRSLITAQKEGLSDYVKKDG